MIRKVVGFAKNLIILSVAAAILGFAGLVITSMILAARTPTIP